MKKALNFVKKYKKSFVFGVIAVLVIVFFVLGGGEKSVATYTVARGDIEESIVLSGKIESSDQADLGFAASGRVARVLVENNQKVSQGQTLAQLEIGDLLADLKIKQTSLNQENTKIQSAYRTMLSSDLELIPGDTDSTVDAPEISGSYSGDEGQYKIIIRKKGGGNDDYELFTFGQEKTQIDISKTDKTPLGSKGLYVSLIGDINGYSNTIWYLNIPNKSGLSYTANLNAYNEAKDAKNNNDTSVAEAEISKINAEIRKNTIYAPFSGIVTNIEREVGESASVGERVISILGEKKLEVVLQVSELDVSKLNPGVSIDVSIDAIPGEVFTGVLKTVNSRETEIEGVPVYEAFVELPVDPRIKAGMNADGIIVLNHKENVLAIPNYVINKVNGKSLVKVILPDGKTEEREVTLGLVGSNSNVEVLSGLSEGEKVISNKDEK